MTIRVQLDQLRGDPAGAELRAVPAAPAPTTAGQLLKRFQAGQCRAVVSAMAELGNRFDRQHELAVSAPVTLDMDGSLSEVYGRLKEMASLNHEGWRGFLSVFVTWDERRRILAANLLKGWASGKPGVAGLLRRALRTLPGGHGPVSLRVDSGFFTVELLEACRRNQVEFCVSVARTEAMWARLYAKLNVKSWRPALDLEDAEVAEFAYSPGGWNYEPLRVIVRRVRVAANEVSGDGLVVAHNLVSMLAAEVAAGNRRRLRERVADAVEEEDLRHAGPERVQPHNLQLVRRWLINVPARVVHSARQVFVRLAAGMLWGEVFKRTYDRLAC